MHCIVKQSALFNCTYAFMTISTVVEILNFYIPFIFIIISFTIANGRQINSVFFVKLVARTPQQYIYSDFI